VSSQAGKVKASQLWFTAPYAVEVRDKELPAPAEHQVLVKTHYSAVSAGSELLLFRGQLPQAMALDSSLESLQQSADYPLQYGYACVGEVQQLGSAVDASWKGRQVFSFQPHASHFLAGVDELIQVPDGVSGRNSVFLPNMETAVNLVHDGRPLMGERVVVIGQGIVGLLLSALLARHPLASLAAVEKQQSRMELSKRLGVQSVHMPEAMEADERPAGLIDADLIYEVSGHPDALNLAIAMSGFSSRVVIGSWYGSKSAAVHLGGEAHRNRLQIVTSQVSTLSPELTGRWNKQRRFSLAWEMIRQTNPEQLITHSVPISEAGDLYQQLHQEDPGITQLLFDYPD